MCEGGGRAGEGVEGVVCDDGGHAGEGVVCDCGGHAGEGVVCDYGGHAVEGVVCDGGGHAGEGVVARAPTVQDPYCLLTRREQVTVFRLRIGHNRLNHHLFSKPRISRTNQYPCSTGSQTTEHSLDDVVFTKELKMVSVVWCQIIEDSQDDVM